MLAHRLSPPFAANPISNSLRIAEARSISLARAHTSIALIIFVSRQICELSPDVVRHRSPSTALRGAVHEVKLTASGAGDAFIAVGIVSYFLAQPALDVEAGIRASEHECGYQNVGDVLCANAKSWCVFVGLTLPGRCQGNCLRALGLALRPSDGLAN